MDLVVEDAYYEAVKKYLMIQCDNLSNIIKQYVSIMNSVVETGFMEGTTSDALKELLDVVKADVGKESISPSDMKQRIDQMCSNFVAKINKADKELY